MDTDTTTRLQRLQRMGKFLGARRTEVSVPRAFAALFLSDLGNQIGLLLAFDAETGRCILSAGHSMDGDLIQEDLSPEVCLDRVEAVMFPLVRKKLDEADALLLAARERERLIRDFDAVST